MQYARCARAVCLLLYLATGGMAQEFEVNIDQLHRTVMELEQELSRLSAQVAQMEGRGDAVRQTIIQKVTSLDSDVKTHSADIHATKTVVTSLVEDSVIIQGKMRVLQEVGSDVNGLRTRVDRMDGSLTSQWDAFQKITVFLNSKVQNIDGAISKLKTDVTSEMGKMMETITSQVLGLKEEYESRLLSVERFMQK